MKLHAFVFFVLLAAISIRAEQESIFASKMYLIGRGIVATYRTIEAFASKNKMYLIGAGSEVAFRTVEAFFTHEVDPADDPSKKPDTILLLETADGFGQIRISVELAEKLHEQQIKNATKNKIQ